MPRAEFGADRCSRIRSVAAAGRAGVRVSNLQFMMIRPGGQSSTCVTAEAPFSGPRAEALDNHTETVYRLGSVYRDGGDWGGRGVELQPFLILESGSGAQGSWMVVADKAR